MILIQLIDTNHPLYELERQLRNAVLLRPIGLTDHAWEMHDKKAWHFVAVQDNEVIGCVVLNPLDDEGNIAQLMQMAVSNDYQGKGIGKLLVKELIRFCRSKSIKEVQCHARDTAVKFYAGLGFEVYNEPFEEVGIKHRHMRKYVME